MTRGGILDAHEGRLSPTEAALLPRIMRRASVTQRAGKLPLWDGYVGDKDGHRACDDVGVSPSFGSFYSWLVKELRPTTVIEFGTAFGVSGMYILDGLEQIGDGTLIASSRTSRGDAWRSETSQRSRGGTSRSPAPSRTSSVCSRRRSTWR